MRHSTDTQTPPAPAPKVRRPWRWIATGSALVVAVVASVGVASAATTKAAPTVRFTKIQYNSPGTDTRSNTSLNAEWVRVTNMTTKAISLKGWTVRDAAGHKYTFPAYTLPKGGSAYVHTGKGINGKPDRQHRYWQSGNYIWNNTGDTATLRNPAGSTVHTCKWRGTGSVTYCATAVPAPPKATRPTTPTILVPTVTVPSSPVAPTAGDPGGIG